MTASFTAKFSPRRTLNGLVLTGLLATLGGAAVAQTPPTGPAGMRAPDAMRDAPNAAASAPARMGYHDPARREAMMAQRHAAMKAALKITPAQETAWATFTAAMKPPARGMGWRQSPEQRAEMDKLATPERIDKMRALRTQRMTERNALANQRGDVTKAFYAQLTAEQKATFDAQHKMRGMEGGKHYGMHHGMHHGGHHGKSYGGQRGTTPPADPASEIRS